MIDITGVFPFSVLQEKYGITVESILRCDPFLANQIVCVFLAGLAMQVLMKLLAKLVNVILARSPEAITDKLLLEQIDVLRTETFFVMVGFFDDWCKKNSIINDPSIDDFVKRVDEGGFKSKDEAIDAYMKSQTRRNVWKEFAIFIQGDSMSVALQHGAAGLFGLYALTMTTDQDSFLMFARWGILFEAGWEVFDLIFSIAPTIFTNEFGVMQVCAIFHHITGFLFLPINQVLLPSKIGRDFTLTLFLYTVLPCMMTPVLFLKNYADFDLTKPSGKLMFMSIQVMNIFTVCIPRGPHWCYFVQKVLRFSWDEGHSWPRIAMLVLCAFTLSCVNLLMIFFTYKGVRNAIKKVQKSTKELKEEKMKDAALLRSRRRSSLLNVIAQEANVSSRRASTKRSISIMGLDFELDDDEINEIEERHKESKGGRRPSLLSFISTTDGTKEE